MPFPRLWASPLHTGGSLGSGLVPAREAEPTGPPWGAGGGFPRWPSPNSPGPLPWPGTAPPTPAKALAEARREERQEDPAPSPQATPFPILSYVPGQHWDMHTLIATSHSQTPFPAEMQILLEVPGPETPNQGGAPAHPAGQGPQDCH